MRSRRRRRGYQSFKFATVATRPTQIPTLVSATEAWIIKVISWLLALAYHYAQLEASAFREEFDPSTFEDPTRPKIDMIHKVMLRKRMHGEAITHQYSASGLSHKGVERTVTE